MFLRWLRESGNKLEAARIPKNVKGLIKKKHVWAQSFSSNDIWMGQWCILGERGEKTCYLTSERAVFFFFLLGCVNRELLWVSGHYTRPNEEIFVNVLYVKYNLLPLPPLGLFSHPSLKPVIFSSHPNCLSFLSAYYRKHTACFWRDFPRRWHKVYFVLPVASHWIICADNVQSTHANEVIPLRPFPEMWISERWKKMFWINFD